MSIQTIVPKTYRLGIIASKSFDNPDFLSEKLGDLLEKISHVYTNGVNKLVEEFCIENGIIYTIYPVVGVRSTLWSNSRIIENSDAVYIISTPDSKNSLLVKSACEKANVKYKVFEFDSAKYWKNIVQNISAILSATDKELIENNSTLKSISKEI